MNDNALIAFIIATLRTGLAGSDFAAMPIVQAFQPTMQGVNTEPTYFIYKVADRRLGFPQKSDYWGNLPTAVFTGFITGSVLTVTALSVGALAVGYVITAIGLPPGTVITSFGTGTGNVGTYNINRLSEIVSQQMTSGPPAMIHREVCQYETTYQLSALATQNPANQTQKTASDMLNYAAYVLQSQPAIATFEDQGVGVLAVKDVRNTPFKDDRDQFEYGPSFDFVMTHKQDILATTPILQSEEIQILFV